MAVDIPSAQELFFQKAVEQTWIAEWVCPTCGHLLAQVVPTSVPFELIIVNGSRCPADGSALMPFNRKEVAQKLADAKQQQDGDLGGDQSSGQGQGVSAKKSGGRSSGSGKKAQGGKGKAKAKPVAKSSSSKTGKPKAKKAGGAGKGSQTAQTAQKGSKGKTTPVTASTGPSGQQSASTTGKASTGGDHPSHKPGVPSPVDLVKPGKP